MKKLTILTLAACSAFATADFTQGFDDITTLPGAGWSQQNLSTTAGSNPPWFQGNATFPSGGQAGGATSYIAANFNGVNTGNLSNWLFTQTDTLQDGATFSFYTRTVDAPQFPDRLEVRLSTAGASTNVGATDSSVGDFTTLLTTVNSGLTPTGYPNTWTQFNIVLSGIGAPTTGRFAFRYSVPNAGPLGANSDFIGVDTVSYVQGVPEPATMIVLGGLAVAAIRRKRK